MEKDPTLNQNKFESEGHLALDRMPPEHLEAWKMYEDVLFAHALTGYNKAESYRQFHVGAAILCYTKSGEYVVYHGGNIKKQAGPQDPNLKKCAERLAIEAAKAGIKKNNDEIEYIIGITVVSPKIQPDIKNAIKGDVLFPCEECRLMFANEPLIKPWTRVNLIKVKDEIDDMREKLLATLSTKSDFVPRGGGDNRPIVPFIMIPPKLRDLVVDGGGEMPFSVFTHRIKEGNMTDL
jgi:cytidine deaminase